MLLQLSILMIIIQCLNFIKHKIVCFYKKPIKFNKIKMKQNFQGSNFGEQNSGQQENMKNEYDQEFDQDFNPLIYKEFQNQNQNGIKNEESEIKNSLKRLIPATAQTNKRNIVNQDKINLNILKQNRPKIKSQNTNRTDIVSNNLKNKISGDSLHVSSGIKLQMSNPHNFKRSSIMNKRRSLNFIQSKNTDQYIKGKTTYINFGHRTSVKKQQKGPNRYFFQNNKDGIDNSQSNTGNQNSYNQIEQNKQKIHSMHDVFQRINSINTKNNRQDKSISFTQAKEDIVFQEPQKNSKRQVAYIKTFILSSFQSISIEISLLNKSIVIMGYMIGQFQDKLQLIFSPQRSQKLLQQSFYDWEIIGKRIYVESNTSGQKKLRIGPLASIFQSEPNIKIDISDQKQPYRMNKNLKHKHQLFLRQKQFINRNYYSIREKDSSLNTLQKSIKTKDNQVTINKVQNIKTFTVQSQQLSHQRSLKIQKNHQINKMTILQINKHIEKHSKHIDYMSPSIKQKVKQMREQKLLARTQSVVQKERQRRENMIKRQIELNNRLSQPKQIKSKSKSKEKVQIKSKSKPKYILNKMQTGINRIFKDKPKILEINKLQAVKKAPDSINRSNIKMMSENKDQRNREQQDTKRQKLKENLFKQKPIKNINSNRTVQKIDKIIQVEEEKYSEDYINSSENKEISQGGQSQYAYEQSYQSNEQKSHSRTKNLVTEDKYNAYQENQDNKDKNNQQNKYDEYNQFEQNEDEHNQNYQEVKNDQKNNQNYQEEEKYYENNDSGEQIAINKNKVQNVYQQDEQNQYKQDQQKKYQNSQQKYQQNYQQGFSNQQEQKQQVKGSVRQVAQKQAIVKKVQQYDQESIQNFIKDEQSSMSQQQKSSRLNENNQQNEQNYEQSNQNYEQQFQQTQPNKSANLSHKAQNNREKNILQEKYDQQYPQDIQDQEVQYLEEEFQQEEE